MTTNKTRTLTFVKRENEEFGGEGWLLEGAPSTYFPISGMGIAHDVLEHRVDDDGSVEHEMLALGAALYIRGEGNYWALFTRQVTTDPGKNVGADLEMLATRYDGLDTLRTPGRTTKLDDHVEEWIDNACAAARDELRHSVDDKKSVENYLKAARGWLRKGYRAARERYEGIAPGALCATFDKIATRADEFLRLADSSYEKLVIVIDEEHLTASVTLHNTLEDDDTDYDA